MKVENQETPVVPEEGTIVAEETPEVILPSDETPFEMPEKFAGKTAEEIAKSYMELESLRNKPEDPKPEDTPNEEPNQDDATTTQDLIEEYATRGTELTEEDYQTLEEKGYSRKQVDIYKAGIEAQAQQEALATLEKAGTTAEEAAKAAEWARDNWSPERVAQFNEAIDGATEVVQIQMLQMLNDSYRSGNVPSLDDNIHAQTNPAPRVEGYESQEQMIADMQDPRYKPGFYQDKAYVAAVKAKAAKSNF